MVGSVLLARLGRQAARVSLGQWLPLRRRLPDRRTIAITFDDGPSTTTPETLAVLAAHRATASFFLCGRRVEARPDLVEAIARAGHGVYPHAYSHAPIGPMAAEQVLDEMIRTEALLACVRSTPSPYLVRLPYGSGHDSLRIHRLLRLWRDDVEIVHWDHSFHDWLLADMCVTMAHLEARCATAVEEALARPEFGGSILLMHEDPIDCAAPLAARIAPVLLQALLTRARQEALVPVALDPGRTAHGVSRFVRPRVVF
jgi:peptidoglycan/xylan/chitin deacetylase (PgdA/CDA1 family)